MRVSQRLRSPEAGPIWGLIFGLLLTGIGGCLWCYTEFVRVADKFDGALAVAALLVGLLSAFYAGRQLRHSHR
ncbi:hypothetical protein AWB74_08394 [Caballeronia arvi]|uniref:Lipoprotein n=1 Tax=Caballeronia arvi TaxID=1777135 RepID=A0A158L3V7_9BURK|nr:hypothetical protein AWB74_08394 [Caballeronia arvi]